MGTHCPTMSEAVDDPVSYFLEDMTYHGKSERTRAAYDRVLREFEAFLRAERGVESPADAEERDCLAYVHTLRGELASSTVATSSPGSTPRRSNGRRAFTQRSATSPLFGPQ